MSEVVTISMWETGVTKLLSPVNVSGNKRQGYTVTRNELPTEFHKKGTFPKSIVLLDAPADGQYILFSNRDAAITGLYFSRDYASVLKIKA